MAVYMDYASPSAQFKSDVNHNLSFRKDAHNYFNELTRKQLNTLDHLSLLDIFLSQGNSIEPHYHQNSSELVYCISGSAIISLLNPFTKAYTHFPVTPGQAVNIPQGWWHYEVATVNNTRLLAIFNSSTIETIFGSDILRLTPPDAFATMYCLDEKKVQETVSPIKETTVLGPPRNCQQRYVNKKRYAPPTHSLPLPIPGHYAFYPQPYSGYGYPNYY